MPNNWFQFKRFIIHHDRCGQKVGTDGVLLGAWANHSSPKRILDIGTGTGLIALMLAQRFEDARITGIEIERECAHQAAENVHISPFADRVTILHSSLQEFKEKENFDLIVSNPPFFERSLRSGNSIRDLARHTDFLPPKDLFCLSADVSHSESRLNLIIPHDKAEDWISLGMDHGWFAIHRTNVRGLPHRPPKRVLLSFARQPKSPEISDLTIENSRHQYSDDFWALVKDFYLDK